MRIQSEKVESFQGKEGTNYLRISWVSALQVLQIADKNTLS